MTWSPRFVALDGDDEVLTWLPGQPIDRWWDRPDLLDRLARTVRELHDATVELTSGHECLIHDDLQPRNVVVDDDRVNLIDWEQLRPGRRIEDVSQLCWSFATGPDGRSVDEVGMRWRRILDTSGFADRSDVVPTALIGIGRCIDDITRQADQGSVRHQRLAQRGDHRELTDLQHWIADHGDQLTDLIA